MEELNTNGLLDGAVNMIDTLKILAIKYGIQAILAIVVLLIGLRIIKAIERGIGRGMEKRDVDVSLRPFLMSVTNVMLKVVLVISVISMIGVETTSFIAVLGAAGLAVGLALSGTLQNFAGGILILILKPFKVGDFVEAQGFTGSVSSIQIFATILKTPDNRTIIIPNGALSTGAVTNYSTEALRRVDMEFGIGYSDDIDKAKAVLNKLIIDDSRILKEPEPRVILSALAASSVNFKVRVWTEAADYWDIFFDFHEKVKKAFDKESIGIPFPQMDVHVHNN
jgi:small conductance mechanosensitive channel